jgi:hypothetical protein
VRKEVGAGANAAAEATTSSETAALNFIVKLEMDSMTSKAIAKIMEDGVLASSHSVAHYNWLYYL